jgi:hypothetical protein
VPRIRQVGVVLVPAALEHGDDLLLEIARALQVALRLARCREVGARVDELHLRGSGRALEAGERGLPQLARACELAEQEQ